MKFSQLILIIMIGMLSNTAHSTTYRPKMVKIVQTKMVIVHKVNKPTLEHKQTKLSNVKPKMKPKQPTMTGIASFYGPGFHGKKTSSGGIYNQNALTAAHRTIPMHSLVNVTNLKNNKSVVVRINDHGPKLKSRILDISVAGAKALGFIKNGIAKVSLKVVK